MVVLALAASSGRAQLAVAQADATADAKHQARELADKGYEEYEARHYAKAVQYFRDAEARFHAPTLLLMQGNAQLKNGGLVEARVLFQRVVDEQLPPDAPKEFIDAQTEAKASLEGLKGRIATLKIVLKGMTPDKVRITIDDVEIPTADILKPLPQNPGPHKIVATLGGDEGGRAVFQAVNLNEGVIKTIQLVFRKGGIVGEPPPTRGCASCEVGSTPIGAEAPVGALSALALTIAGALRRRRRAR
jgi:hypothetical protein